MNGAGKTQPRSSASSGSPAVSAGARRFARTSKLLKHADFERVYEQGKRIFSGHVTVFYRLRGDEGGPRVGFTVSRARGGAVERNRMKRRLREAVRLLLDRLHAPADVAINPKRTLLTAEFVQIVAELERAFVQIERAAVRPHNHSGGATT